MGILPKLSGLALRPVLRGLGDALGLGAAEEISDVMTRSLQKHFVDHSLQLTQALQRANTRAWVALEFALTEEKELGNLFQKVHKSVKDLCTSADVKALRGLIQKHPQLQQDPGYRQNCLQELVRARKDGILTNGTLSGDSLLAEAGEQVRFSNPQKLLQVENRKIAELADELQRNSLPHLARLLECSVGETPLLVLAVRFYFRREIEQNDELFRGVAFEKLDQMGGQLERGFSQLEQVLDQLADLHREAVAGRQAAEGAEKVGQENHLLLQQIQQEMRQFMKQKGVSKQGLTTRRITIHSDQEKKLVKHILEQYRRLPDNLRQSPDLLNDLGTLFLGMGQLDHAQRAFEVAAHRAGDDLTRGMAHFHAYQTHLEGDRKDQALEEYKTAVKFVPQQYSLFPFEEYPPERILGVGGFGVTFLCRYRETGSLVAVKCLLDQDLDRETKDVFAEAAALDELNHPGIIRFRTCGYADPDRKNPYMVLEYFDGQTLEDYVQAQGVFDQNEFLTLATLVAEAIQAAHGKGILHRDIKPANILVKKEGDNWQVKVIDFGLALKPQILESMTRSTSKNRSIAGTLDYAAPEQMGRLPHKPSFSSDVYGFAKTCCYALFQKTEVTFADWVTVPKPLAEMLSDCLQMEPEKRLSDFSQVIQRLNQVQRQIDQDKETQRKQLATLEAKKQIQKKQARVQKKQAQRQADDETFALTEDFAVNVFCPSCESKIRLRNTASLGKKIECPLCKYRFVAEATGEDNLPRKTTRRRVPTERFPHPRQKTQSIPVEANANSGSTPQQRLVLVGVAVGIVLLFGVGVILLSSGRSNQLDKPAQRSPFPTVQANNNLHPNDPGEAGNPAFGQEDEDSKDPIVPEPDDPNIRVLPGHTQKVLAVAFSTNGNQFLSTSEDRTLRIWNRDTEKSTPLLGLTSVITQAVYLPGDKQVVTFDRGKKVRWWDLESQTETRRPLDAQYAAFSADGKRGLVFQRKASQRPGFSDPGVIDGGEMPFSPGFPGSFPEEGPLMNPSNGGSPVRVFKDSNTVLKMWDLVEGKEGPKWTALPDRITHLELTAFGHRAVVAGYYNNVKEFVVHVLDLNTGKELRKFVGPVHGVRSVVLSHDERHALFIAFRNAERTQRDLQLWDIVQGKRLRTLEGPTDQAESVVFSADDRFALVGLKGSPDRVQLWDLEKGKQLRKFLMSKQTNSPSFGSHFGSANEEVPCVAFSPDGQWALAGGKDQSLWLWKVPELDISPLPTPDPQTPIVEPLPIVKNPSKKEPGELAQFKVDWKGHVQTVAFSPDGKYFLAGGRDKTLYQWNWKTNQVVKFQGHNHPIQQAVFSATGKQALSTDLDGSSNLGQTNQKGLFQWDPKSPQAFKSFPRAVNDLRWARYSADGERLLLLAQNQVEVWDVPHKTKLSNLPLNGTQLVCMQIAPNGRTGLFGLVPNNGQGLEFQLLNLDDRFKRLNTWKTNDNIPGQPGFVPFPGDDFLGGFNGGASIDVNISLALSPRGTYAALAVPNSPTITVWNLTQVGTPSTKIHAHKPGVRCLAFSPDEKWLLSGGDDKIVRLWDVTSWKEVCSFEGHSGNIQSVAFSPDAKLAISGGGYTLNSRPDGYVRIWQLPE